MKITLIAAALAAIILTGCSSPAPSEPEGSTPPTTENSTSSNDAPAKLAYDLGSIKKGDKANCVICNVGGAGHGEEPAADVIDYEGKTYAFCNESEKAEFISNPTKYAQK